MNDMATIDQIKVVIAALPQSERSALQRWMDDVAADAQTQFNKLGVAIVEYALTADDLVAMDAAFPVLGQRKAGARTADFAPESRAWLAGHPALLLIASQLLKSPATLTRLQAFDKSEHANWFVPWHQDRAEDGQERAIPALEKTIALRIHLDDCDEANGPLEVIPGSHGHGRLGAEAIVEWVATRPSRLCLAVRGDILAMRPLLIHRSQRAQKPVARRVIHLEYLAAS
jgi:Phytanoyl-CoA dioxygenase (PhyH)